MRAVHGSVVRVRQYSKRHGTWLEWLHVLLCVCTLVRKSGRPVIERRHAQIELHAMLLLSRVIPPPIVNSTITNPAHARGSNASTISAWIGASLTSSMITLPSIAKKKTSVLERK